MNSTRKISAVIASVVLTVIFALPSIALASSLNGRITDDQYVVIYTLRIQKGDAVDATVTRLSGDLVPRLVIRAQGKEQPIAFSDDNASNDETTLAYSFPDAGYYELIVTRLDAEEGTTTGDFVLSVNGVSVQATSTSKNTVPTTNYPAVILFSPGNTQGNITNDTYVVYYLVYLQIGWKLDVKLDRADGDLQPLLGLLDIQDDTNTIERGKAESDTTATLIYTSKKSDWYRLAVTRFDVDEGDTQGKYKLSVSY